MTRTHCSVCGDDLLVDVLKLPPTPHANAFKKSAEASLALPRHDLTLQLCQACGHIQLSHVADPVDLFFDYVYTSGSSPALQKHFDDYAQWCVDTLKLSEDSFVVEIGSNDGTLLDAFKRRGMRVLGVEPAEALAELARQKSLSTVTGFFDVSTAHHILDDHGPADLICANNVLAHVPELQSTLAGVKILLETERAHTRGRLVFEVQYVKELLAKRLFDMVYHEHMHYHSVRALELLLASEELVLQDVVKVPTHGGSIRCVVGVAERCRSASNNLAAWIIDEHESALFQLSAWRQMQGSVAGLPWQVSMLLAQEEQAKRTKPAKLIGFGAPAKACTLLATLGRAPSLENVSPLPLSQRLVYVVDDSPLKQGLFVPGTGLEVRPASALEQEDPANTILVILAWNYAEEIMKRYSAFHAQGGRFLIPLPSPKLV